MRKIFSFVLITSLVIASFAFAFAEIEGDARSLLAANFNDVAGGKYEDAVTDLVDGGVIDGYPDGTFRPDATIKRAEACKVVIQLLAIADSDLKKAPASGFPDMDDYAWALDYVNYAAAKGIITGYPDGTFKPEGNVTYAEMAAMLVRALGYKVADLKGDWPENFMNKAQELGLMKGVYGSANVPAVRGDVALMGQKVLWELEERENGSSDKVDNLLADYNGRAFGILLDVASVSNDKGKAVDEYEFLFGSQKLYLQTNGKVERPLANVMGNWIENGVLVGLQIKDGLVTKIGNSVENPAFNTLGQVSGFENLTSKGAIQWAKVKEAKDRVIVTYDKYGAGLRDTFAVLDNASIYVAEVKNNKITAYKSGSFRDIKEDKFVRIYAVTGKNKGVGEIVFVSSINPTP